MSKLLSILIVVAAIACSVNGASYNSQYCLGEGLHNNDCSWYENCLENKFQCGPQGYPVGYGYKYCTKFIENYSSFSPKGKQWIDQTLTCLKSSLASTFTQSPSPTCTQVKAIAFNSHPKCYVSAGFCELFTEQDIHQIYTTLLSLMSVYDLSDFIAIQSIKQVISVVYQCSKKII